MPDEDDSRSDLMSEGRGARVVRSIAGCVALVGIGWLVVTHPRGSLFVAIAMVMLGVSVLVHEWGHYIAARRRGLAVREFSIGFGRPLWSRERDGVKWSLKVIPLGGSVDIAGMTVEAARRDSVPTSRTYIHAPVRSRLVVVLSGVLVNIVVAWFCFAVASLGVMPDGTGVVESVIFAVLNGVLVVVRIAGIIGTSLWAAVSQWDVEVGTVLVLPQSLDEGVQGAESGGIPLWAYLVLALGLINLSLAVFNMLPLHPLDGYHAAAAVADGARRFTARRPVEPLTEAQMAWYARGTSVVLALFVISMFTRDVARLLSD